MDDINTLKMQSVILDYMSDSIFVHDLEGKFVYVNKEAYESRGYTKEELLSMHVKDLDAPMNDESIKKMKSNIAKMKEQGFVTFEIEHQRKDKTIMPVEIRSQIFILNDEKLVISVARDISERKKVQERLKTLAMTDALTELYNRHKFELLYELEVEMLRLERSEMSLLLIDLDYFKKINDNYGHDMGDTVLKEFGDLLSDTFRRSDIIARWGGEEFIVLLPKTKLEEALKLSQDLIAKTASYKFSHNESMTTSIGVASYHEKETLKQFTKRADIALYKAKNLGRNRVEFYSEGEKVSDDYVYMI